MHDRQRFGDDPQPPPMPENYNPGDKDPYISRVCDGNSGDRWLRQVIESEQEDH